MPRLQRDLGFCSMSPLPLLDTKEALPEPTSMGCVSLQTNRAVFFSCAAECVFFIFLCYCHSVWSKDEEGRRCDRRLYICGASLLFRSIHEATGLGFVVKLRHRCLVQSRRPALLCSLVWHSQDRAELILACFPVGWQRAHISGSTFDWHNNWVLGQRQRGQKWNIEM